MPVIAYENESISEEQKWGRNEMSTSSIRRHKRGSTWKQIYEKYLELSLSKKKTVNNRNNFIMNAS